MTIPATPVLVVLTTTLGTHRALDKTTSDDLSGIAHARNHQTISIAASTPQPQSILSRDDTASSIRFIVSTSVQRQAAGNARIRVATRARERCEMSKGKRGKKGKAEKSSKKVCQPSRIFVWPDVH